MFTYDPDNDAGDEGRRDRRPPQWLKDLRKIVVKTVPFILAAVILTWLGFKNRDPEAKKVEAPTALSAEVAEKKTETRISAPVKPRVSTPSDGNVCPVCGSPMVKRNGKYGEFYGCSTFPACRGTRPLETTEKLSEEVKTVTVTFVIAGGHKDLESNIILFNSMKDYKSPDCKTVLIDLEKCPQCRKIDPQRYLGYSLTATGKESEYKSRKQITVDNPLKLRIEGQNDGWGLPSGRYGNGMGSSR